MKAASRFLPSKASDLGPPWIVGLAFCSACIPLLCVAFPPVMDYPNHLARIWLLSGGASRPPLSSMYVADWSRASTNVGVDWLAATAGRVLPLTVLDILLRVLMFIGPAAATAGLGRAVFGRISVWHIAPLAFAWSTTAIAGFMSYTIALGAGALAAIMVQRRHAKLDAPMLLKHLLYSTLLLWLHPFGLLFYLALTAGIIAGPERRGPFAIIAANGSKILLFAMIGVIPVFVLFLAAKQAPNTGSIDWGTLQQHLFPKAVLKTLLSPGLSYNLGLDILLLAPFAIVVFASLYSDQVRVHWGLLFIVVLLVIAALIAPIAIGDASWLDRRIPPMAALAFCAAILPEPQTRRWSVFISAALVLAIGSRIAWITAVWLQRDNDVRDMLEVTQAIRPGDAIIVVQQQLKDGSEAPIGRTMVGAGNGNHPVRRHLPALLVPFKRAFIPTLFAIPGQQPLRIANNRIRDAVPSSEIPFSGQLLSGNKYDSYLSRLRCDFEFVLVIGVDERGVPFRPDRSLKLVQSKGFVTLFRVSKLPMSSDQCH